MRGKQERALRVIAGALLGSELDPRDLLEISERLTFDRKWTERLSSLIRELAHASERTGLGRYLEVPAPEHETAADFAEELTRLFSRKRLRKLEALKILRKVSGSQSWKLDPRRTLRENVTELIATLSGPKEASTLVVRVAQFLGYPGDSYLRELS